MSDATSATGTLLYAGTAASPPVFSTPVSELVTIQPPASFRNEIDVTNHNEGEDAFVPGIRRKDPVTGRINKITGDASHDQMEADYNAAVKRAYRIVYPDGDRANFEAYVLRWAPVEATVDSAKQFDFTLRIAGQVTWDVEP